MNSIWNGKPTGLFSALFLGFGICIRRLSTKLTTWLFLLNVCKHGKQILVMPGLRYRIPRGITLGSNITIGENVELTAEMSTSTLFIGNGASLGNNCCIDFTGGISLAPKVHIAHDVIIITHSHGYNYENRPEGSRLVIEEHAFIGSRSLITYNCNYIGRNSIVGAGSVVTKDVPDYAVVAGNPARIIKYIKDPNSL